MCSPMICPVVTRYSLCSYLIRTVPPALKVRTWMFCSATHSKWGLYYLYKYWREGAVSACRQYGTVGSIQYLYAQTHRGNEIIKRNGMAFHGSQCLGQRHSLPERIRYNSVCLSRNQISLRLPRQVKAVQIELWHVFAFGCLVTLLWGN